MNPIDAMLLKHSNKIEIKTFYKQTFFNVIFSGLPSSEALEPLVQLINTGRFDWFVRTRDDMKKKQLKELFSFWVKKANLIPVSDAIAALAQMWRDAGYIVTIDGQPEQAQDEPQPSIAER